MNLTTLYYHFRPYIPRSVQIAVRRAIVRRKLRLYADVWPIDPKSATPPPGWQGWPEGKKFAFVITHDVETAEGVGRCLTLARIDREYGFRSAFNFVAEDYPIPEGLREGLLEDGFEIGLHGLSHTGNLYGSQKKFRSDARRINRYIEEWKVDGFRSPSMYHNLDWIQSLNVTYDSSTFDTDPFEPQPDGLGTIFPKWISGTDGGYVELPYTLPQDFMLFVLMKEKNISIWKAKLDWIAQHGGMALLLVHPDYLTFTDTNGKPQYSVDYYRRFLEHVKETYEGQYWHALPKEVARHSVTIWKSQKEERRMPVLGRQNRKIWIDLDNTPHVPFFDPIMTELKKKGYEVILTARDCAQTCALADLFSMKYQRIGRHYGKKRVLKVAGTILRALQLSRRIREQEPDIAVSHGSRAQMMAALFSHVPSIAIMDYEHVEGFIRPTWVMMPEVINGNSLKFDPDRIIRYPGIKEDVYVPYFRPDPRILKDLKVDPSELLVTIRPPATEAHYHNPEAEELFLEAVNCIGATDSCRMVILPRNEAQKVLIEGKWSEWCSNGKILIPDHVVDGLNLLWYSDFAISGGGTMNREAAALGVPVYSIFRGKIGDVDRYLAQSGRLILLEKVEDIHTKLTIAKRCRPSGLPHVNGTTLNSVVESIVRALNAGGGASHPTTRKSGPV